MIDLTQLEPNGAASLLLGAVPHVALMIFTPDFRIALATEGTALPGRPGRRDTEGRAVSEVLAPEEWQR